MSRLQARYDGPLLALLLSGVIALKAWLVQAAGIDLHFDEAQYWEWSQQLDWSYYSKGPLVAWLIALSEAAFGHGAWQARLPAWLAHALFIYLIFIFSYHVFHSRAAAWWSALLALTTPLLFTLGLVITTDVLLLALWTWGLWAAYRALFRNSRGAWFEFGAALGIGALTKLSIVLLPLVVGIMMGITPRWRVHFKQPYLWGGLLIALLCAAPMLYWNSVHDWVMFRHNRGHMANSGVSLTQWGEFIGGQLAALSPLVAVLAVTVLWRKPPSEDQRFLWWVSLCVIGFFIIKALISKVQLNWAAPGYVGMIIVVGGALPHFSKIKRALLYAGLASSVVIMSVAYFPYTFGLGAGQDPFKKTRAWDEPVRALSAQAPPTDFILTSAYTLAGELAFYWPRRVPVYITGDTTRRFNQHDLWPSIDREAGRDGLYISVMPELPPQLTQAFRRCTPLRPVPAHAPDGTLLRTLYASVCEDYRPIMWPQPATY